jgi:hypothetical protein
MRAVDLAATLAVAAIRDQPSDPRANQGDLLDELLDGLDVVDGAAAAGASGQGNLDLLIVLRGSDAIRAGVPLGASRPLFLAVGNLLGLTAAERSRLACGPALRLVELVAELAVLGLKQADPLLKLRDAGQEKFRAG